MGRPSRKQKIKMNFDFQFSFLSILKNNFHFHPVGSPLFDWRGQGAGLFLLLISQYGVAVLASADAPCIYHVADEDAAVADLSRVGCIDNHLHGRLDKLIAANNGDSYALNDIR